MTNMHDIPKTFAGRLRYLREKKRISRRVLSELCGLSHAMVSRYERGEQEPTLGAIIELADFFEVTTDFLCCRK